MTEVLESAKYVSEKSNLVAINNEKIEHFARRTIGHNIKLPLWDSGHHFSDGTAKTVSYFLILDSLNFCFWPEARELRWESDYQAQKLSGYSGLAASLKKAVLEGLPILEAGFLSEMTLDELKRLLGGKNELQLMNERRDILNELGRVLLENYQGQAVYLVEEASGSALNLATLIAEKLNSFRDIACYKDRKVFFLKRAQIFAADLYGVFQGKGWGRFGDMEKLTAFADYKLPQVLRHLGILTYSPKLAQMVDNQILLFPGSVEEIEIRANTIWAVEGIRQKIEQVGRSIKAFEIDWLLWNMGQKDTYRAKPYHRTRTIFY